MHILLAAQLSLLTDDRRRWRWRWRWHLFGSASTLERKARARPCPLQLAAAPRQRWSLLPHNRLTSVMPGLLA